MAPSANLLLYVDAQFASPYAMSAFVALDEKAVRFDISTVDLGSNANQEPSYVSCSLTRRVPTLVHEDFSLSESSAITEYLEEAFCGPPLYPKNARLRARARQLQAWLRSDLMLIRQERTTEGIFYRPVNTPLSDEAMTETRKLFSVFDTLLPHGEPYLFGQWSIVDVDLAIMLNRLVLNGDPVPANIAAYAKHHWERPSVQLWVNQPRQKLGR